MSRIVPILLLGLGCATAAPRTPIRVPAPEAGAMAEPDAAPSEATVEVVLRSEALQEAVDRELPNPIHRENGRRLQAEAERGDLRLEPGRGGLLWTLPVEFWARARLGPLRFTCGVDEPRPHVDVTLRTELRIDDEWNLTTATTPAAREWSRPCRISFLNIDVTSMIDPHVARAQARAAQEIDREAARIDLKRLLERVWPLLSFPVELEREGAADERLRFLLRPEGLRVAELTGDASALRLRVAVLGRFLVTSRFVSSAPGPLPPPGEARAEPFIAHVELTRELGALLEHLGTHLAGTRAPLGDGTVTIETVEGRLTPEGLAIGFRLGGARSGTLWAMARPVHHEGALRLIDPRWTPATLHALDDEDHAEALGSAIFPKLEGWTWPIDAAMAEARSRTVAGMRGFELPEGVSIHAELEATPSGGAVFGEGETLVVRVPTPGTLTVTIDAATVAESLPAE